MKRKISVMVVLVFCISVCLSSMSFANSSTISGTLGSHSVLGRLTMSSNGASAHTGHICFRICICRSRLLFFMDT